MVSKLALAMMVDKLVMMVGNDAWYVELLMISMMHVIWIDYV